MLTVDEIGSILREARELKGATLTEVHQNLRISVKFLKALEAGEYHLLPSPTHVRGYLGKYARFLGLEPVPLLERYEAVKEHLPPPVAAVATTPNYTQNQLRLPEPDTGTFFEVNPVEVGPTAQTGSDWISRLIIVALIISIGLISWRFAPLVLNRGDEAAGLNTTAAQDVLDALTNAQVLTATMDLSETPGFDGLPTGRATNPEGDSAAVATPAAVQTRPLLPATMERIEIQVDVTERTWLAVVVDDVIAYEGQAKKGDAFTWEAADFVNLRTGNGAGVFVKINGVDLGPLGERSSVVEETWQTTR